MESVHGVDGEPLEQTVGQHRLGAGSGLFGGLEQQSDGAVELMTDGECRGGPEDHRHMPVVTAGVHG